MAKVADVPALVLYGCIKVRPVQIHPDVWVITDPTSRYRIGTHAAAMKYYVLVIKKNIFL